MTASYEGWIEAGEPLLPSLRDVGIGRGRGACRAGRRAGRFFGGGAAAPDDAVGREQADRQARNPSGNASRQSIDPQVLTTAEGCAFYERATRILADLDGAERGASSGERPVGRVRLGTSASYATHVLAPALPAFLDLHPGVSLDIAQTDAVIDLLAERTDVAARAGPLKSSSLVARKLEDTAMTIVASLGYLEKYREPRTIAELESPRGDL